MLYHVSVLTQGTGKAKHARGSRPRRCVYAPLSSSSLAAVSLAPPRCARDPTRVSSPPAPAPRAVPPPPGPAAAPRAPPPLPPRPPPPPPQPLRRHRLRPRLTLVTREHPELLGPRRRLDRSGLPGADQVGLLQPRQER